MKNLKDIIVEKLRINKANTNKTNTDNDFECLLSLTNCATLATRKGEYKIMGIVDEIGDADYVGYIVKFPKRIYLGEGLFGESLICLRPDYYINETAYDGILEIYPGDENCICEPGQSSYLLQGGLTKNLSTVLANIIGRAGGEEFFEGETSKFKFNPDYLKSTWYEKR